MVGMFGWDGRDGRDGRVGGMFRDLKEGDVQFVFHLGFVEMWCLSLKTGGETLARRNWNINKKELEYQQEGAGSFMERQCFGLNGSVGRESLKAFLLTLEMNAGCVLFVRYGVQIRKRGGVGRILECDRM
jgi:hypothetical protein